MQELEDIRKSGLKVFKDILVDESNILVWKGLIVPVRCQFQPIYLWLYNNTTTITFPDLCPGFHYLLHGKAGGSLVRNLTSVT